MFCNKNVICPKCGKRFATEQTLYYHLIKKKNKCNTLKCNICNNQFKNKQEFDIHNTICRTMKTSINEILSNLKNDIQIINKNDNSVIQNWMMLHKYKGQLCNHHNFNKIEPYIEQYRPFNNPLYNEKSMDDLYNIIEYYAQY